MLQEVHEQEIIEEIPEPIFAVSMVLVVPTKSSASHHADRRTQSGLHSAMRSVSNAHFRNQQERKGVTFPEKSHMEEDKISDDEGRKSPVIQRTFLFAMHPLVIDCMTHRGTELI